MPAGAALAKVDERALLGAYARARVADSAGAANEAAENYAAALALSPDNDVLAARVLSQAIEAGNRRLAVSAARRLERSPTVAPDARLLLIGEALREREWKTVDAHILQIEQDEVFAFMAPVLRAWTMVDRRKGDPLAALAAAGSNPLASGYAAEHRPLILIARGDGKAGVPELLKLTQAGGARATRLRIAAAARLARKGDRAEALALLQGDAEPLVKARRLVETRQPVPGEIGGALAGIGEFLVRIAVDLNSENTSRVALSYARLATFFAPENSETWLVTSELLEKGGRPADALAAVANISANDPFADAAADDRVRLLVATGARDTALAEAKAAVGTGNPSAKDWLRLADLQADLEQLPEAAAAYERALAAAGGSPLPSQPEWTLHLLRGGALERANKWPEAKAALQAAYKLAPDQPLVLNYLGYAQLERRENIAEAMQLIALASKLQPDSAEITDSLGWAHYLQGDVAKAIQLLERAVAGEPADPAINEHLGDAYYSAGRRYEARYAWEAALLHAESDDAKRLRSKIVTGLTPELASP